MFIIVNEDNRIIATSSKLLDKIGVQSIYELILLQEKSVLTLDKQKWELVFKGNSITVGGEATKIVSLLGDMTLITVKEIKENLSIGSSDDYKTTTSRVIRANSVSSGNLVDLLLGRDKPKEEIQEQEENLEQDLQRVKTPKVKVTINPPRIKKSNKKITPESEKEETKEVDSTIKKATLAFNKDTKESLESLKKETQEVSKKIKDSSNIEDGLGLILDDSLDKKDDTKAGVDLKEEGILSLDEILAKETKEKETKKEKEPIEDDGLGLIFEDLTPSNEPEPKREIQEEKKEEDILSLDEILEKETKEPEVKESEPEPTLDLGGDELELSLEEPKEEPKKEETKEEAKDELEEFSIDDLLIEEPEVKETKEPEAKETKESVKTDEELSLDDDELFSLLDEDEQEETQTDKVADSSKSSEPLDDDIFDLLSEESLDSSSQTDTDKPKNSIIKDVTPKEDEIFDIVDDEIQTQDSKEKESIKDSNSLETSSVSEIDMNQDNNITSTSNTQGDKWRELLDKFHFNLETNASNAGMDVEEYKELIDFFLQENQRVEADLKSSDISKVDEASRTLEDAAILLQLEPLPEFFKLLREESSPSKREIMVDAYYEKIVDELMSEPETSMATESDTISSQEPEIELETITEQEPTPAEPETEVKNSNCNIESAQELLKDENAIPINFSLKMAAEELNLPEELVLEFINDFSSQGHEYLPVLIESCKNGDLDKLQKTAHMLKGAASNLRIEPMVDNLYQLQYDEDISNAPERIRKFAGQLIGLDHYLKQFK